MRNVYMCEYCGFIGTENIIKTHEKTCIHNPEVRCCENCKYAHIEPYLTTTFGGGFGNFGMPTSPKNMVCKYREYIENSKNINSICSISDPIALEGVCEHYERGTPNKVIPI